MRTITLVFCVTSLLAARDPKVEEIFEPDVVYGKGGEVD